MRLAKLFVLLSLALSCIPALAASPTRVRSERSRPSRPRVLTMKATAFSQEAQLTAAGTVPHEGIVAADPDILPLGTIIRVTGAGPYNGRYVVTDTGSKVVGHHIDVYLASDIEAKRFGKKRVRVQVLDRGEGAKDARRKDPVGAAAAGVNSADRAAPK